MNIGEIKGYAFKDELDAHEKWVYESEDGRHGIKVVDENKLAFYNGYDWIEVTVDPQEIRDIDNVPLRLQVSDKEPPAEDGRIYYNSKDKLFYVARNNQWYRLFVGGDEKLEQDPPKEAPKLISKTDTTVSLVVNEDMQFRYQGGSWQDDNYFAGLQRNETYYFEQRYKADEVYKASPPSPILEVTTDKGEQTPPTKPKIEVKKLSDSIQVIVNATGTNQEVALMGGTNKPSESSWRQDRAVYNCKFETTYTAYARKKETHTHMASEASEGYTFTTPEDEIFLKELPIGARVKHKGMVYDGEPIEWIKVTHDGHYTPGETIFITEDIISEKAFDAEEPKNSNSDREHYGNNNYELSNIDQWLNSKDKNWYSARHGADQAPTSSYVTSSPYADEAGFLFNFTDEALENIKDTTIVTAKHSADGDGTKTLKRKIFLMSRTEAGLGDEFSGRPEGKPFSYFTSDERRKANRYYWLRTPYADRASVVRYVNSGGSLDWNSAYLGHFGVRPALSLSSSLKVNKTPNDDGSYNLKF